jgi:O-acetyl-ADP-ribose deacetylase (regulator of RNase III)
VIMFFRNDYVQCVVNLIVHTVLWDTGLDAAVVQRRGGLIGTLASV